MIKERSEVHLSIPVHKGKILGVGLLKKLIAKAGLTNEEYINLFYIDEKFKQLPELTPAQLYDAFSFYYDPQDEIEQELELNSEVNK